MGKNKWGNTPFIPPQDVGGGKISTWESNPVTAKEVVPQEVVVEGFKNTFTCDVCGKSTPTEVGMTRHKLRVHP